MQGGDSFSEDGYKYTYADRVDMDRKAWLGAEGHHHAGGTIALSSPSGAPTLTRSSTGGLIPAGTRVYYKISLVNTQGQESEASTEAFIDTTAAITDPNAPTLTYSSNGGALLGGDYYYVLSAWKGTSITETTATSSIFIAVTSTTGTNKITLTLPTLPAGANGFNIYRRAPGESRFFYLDSLNIGATPASTYVDSGAVAENCDRTVPNANTTNAQNSIVVTYPGTTPHVPVGYTWKIYRSYFNGNYTKSLLVHVVEYTAEATPIITPTYTDVGLATGPGSPLTSVPTLTNPSKVILTDGAEVTGTLPMGQESFPFEVTFDWPGDFVAPNLGIDAWVCEFPAATIIGCRATLGVGKTAPGDALVDVRKGPSSATPTFTTIYTTPTNRPVVRGGQTRGLRTSPDVRTLLVGDLLTADLISVSGGGSVSYLSVTVYMIAHGYPAVTYVPGTTTGT